MTKRTERFEHEVNGERRRSGERVVWLARHGNRQDFVDPDWPQTAERPHDPGLSPDGMEQARRLAERLRTEEIAHLFASPFLRTVQTAHYVAEALDLPLFLEPGVCEWLNPEWYRAQPDLLPADVLRADYPRVDPTHRPVLQPRFPETEPQALARAGETVRQLVERYPGPLLVVGHGASVSGIAITLADADADMECALCSLFRLEGRADEWTLALCGDVSHLDEALGADRFN